jgi:hypothetical protein
METRSAGPLPGGLAGSIAVSRPEDPELAGDQDLRGGPIVRLGAA